MIGFNLPAFKWLDDFSLEVEYFGNKYMPDYSKLEQISSPIPKSAYWKRTANNPEPYDVNGDNVKWSLYAAKIIAGHIKFSGQAASDHLRLGETQPYPWKTFEETLTTLKDWYWMTKLTFFF